MINQNFEVLLPRLVSAAQSKFPGIEIRYLNQMKVNEKAVVAGIFIKKVCKKYIFFYFFHVKFQIKNQPEILNEYDEGFKESEFENRLSEDDVIGFEDDSQKTVIDNIDPEKACQILTGQVAGKKKNSIFFRKI